MSARVMAGRERQQGVRLHEGRAHRATVRLQQPGLQDTGRIRYI